VAIERRGTAATIGGIEGATGGLGGHAGDARMKAFLLSVVAAIALAVGGYLVVGEFQQTVYEAFTTQGVRL
jgi:hypothetical protein